MHSKKGSDDMRIGFHFPFSGNMKKLVERVRVSRGNTFQIFVRGLRGGKQQMINGRKLSLLNELVLKKDIDPIVVHAPFSYNLAQNTTEDIVYMQEDMEFLKKVNAKYYVLQPGYSKKEHPFFALNELKRHLKIIIEETDWQGEILIKNMAGAGTELGRNLEEWNELITFHPRIKGALDFARMHASGHSFGNEEEAKTFFQTIEERVGWEKIKVLYITDTMKECGSKKNNYVPLGEGVIGFKGYNSILSQDVLKEKVWIVENQPTIEHYDRSIEYLTRFFS